MNAVLVKGDAVGPTLYYGAGAGAEPTASAVVADLIDIVRTSDTAPDDRVPYSGFQSDALVDLPVLDIEQVESAYYIRMEAEDRPGVTADVSGILGNAGISIEAIHQQEPDPGESRVPLVMLTHTVEEGKMNRAIEQIEKLDSIAGQVTRIRMEHLEG
jgi:homoserine dehydrogenase